MLLNVYYADSLYCDGVEYGPGTGTGTGTDADTGTGTGTAAEPHIGSQGNTEGSYIGSGNINYGEASVLHG